MFSIIMERKDLKSPDSTLMTNIMTEVELFVFSDFFGRISHTLLNWAKPLQLLLGWRDCIMAPLSLNVSVDASVEFSCSGKHRDVIIPPECL